MAEAMIAGLLRGELVEPGQVVASHPRAGAARASSPRELRDPDGRRQRRGGRRAPTSSCSRSSPRCSPGSAASCGPHLRDGQLVLSVIAGATTAALDGLPRPRPDRAQHAQHAGPARARDDRLVRDARDDRRAARPGERAPAARSARELEVDDEKFVAMATAVSGTGPTYVFLVMEALIDAAVHLGFPRHVAHDLVDRDARGQHATSPSSRATHPAVLRNMVTSPGGTQRRGAPRARVGPAPDGPVGGGLGRLPPDGRARRPARGERRRRPTTGSVDGGRLTRR